MKHMAGTSTPTRRIVMSARHSLHTKPTAGMISNPKPCTICYGSGAANVSRKKRRSKRWPATLNEADTCKQGRAQAPSNQPLLELLQRQAVDSNTEISEALSQFSIFSQRVGVYNPKTTTRPTSRWGNTDDQGILFLRSCSCF